MQARRLLSHRRWSGASQQFSALDPTMKLAGIRIDMLRNLYWDVNRMYSGMDSILCEAANLFRLSNLIVAESKQDVDSTPPSMITDLYAGSATQDSIIPTLKAPGDYGMVSTAAQYDTRCAAVTNTEGNWETSTQVAGEETPQSREGLSHL